jgi:hypothetical protein
LKQEKHVARLAGLRVAVRLQALRADLLHHALHRRIDRADREVPGLEVLLQQLVAGARHCRHHAVRADRDHAIGILEAQRRRAEPSLGIRVQRLHEVADEARSCGRPGVKPGSSSQHHTTTSAAFSISSTL